MHILCIDDDPVYLLVLKTTLTKFNNEDTIAFADSGEKGLELLGAQHFDLLITDLNLPGLSGLDLLKKAKEQNSDIEVFIISGLATLNEAIDAIKSGARDFLLKPLNPAMITEKISMIREMHDRRKEADDYRMAKETIENQARDSIAQLEVSNSKVTSVLHKIIKILEMTEEKPSKKLEQIRLVTSEALNPND